MTQISLLSASPRYRWLLPILTGASLWIPAQPNWAQSPPPPPPAEATPIFTPAPRPTPTPTPEYFDPLFPLPEAAADPAALESEAQPVQGRQDPNLGRVIGRVLNPVGQPVAGAQIRLEIDANAAAPAAEIPVTETVATAAAVTEETPENQPLVTDEQGSFELFTDQFGRYPLTIWHPDFERATTPIWVQPGLTTPVDVVLETPLVPQPRTRLGILGVGGLDHTQTLAQRLAVEALRVGLIPQSETVVPLDNRKLLPILREVNLPLYELFEFDRRKPEAVQRFLDLLGLRAVVISRVDVLTRPSSPTDVDLKSRSRVELWTIDDQGQLQVQVLAEASRSATENSDLNAKEIAQLYQVQVTRMAQEIGERWQQGNPLAAYFDPNSGLLSPQQSRLDTTVELAIPNDPLPAPETPAPPASPATPPANPTP